MSGALLNSHIPNSMSRCCCYLRLPRTTAPRCAACFRLPPYPFLLAMVPKTRATKDAKKTGKALEKSKKAMPAQMRRENTFFPLALKVSDLMARYSFQWSVKTKDHEAVEVLPTSVPGGADKFAFFTGYFYCGLLPPFSAFFDEVMRTQNFLGEPSLVD
ncbi:hypothetical protein VPH35_123646 [Triticum aestivum]